jgi:hypothetical protein
MRSSTEILTIDSIALDVRNFIEATPRSERPFAMRDFPNGACGDTTLILRTLLGDLGYKDLERVSGQLDSIGEGKWTHSWLACGNLIVDVTGDQFDDGPPRVFVSSASVWHQQFAVFSRCKADLWTINGPEIPALREFYLRLRSMIFSGRHHESRGWGCKG